MERIDKTLPAFRWEQIRAAAKVPLICVYENPADYPGKYVARLWDLQRPTGFVMVADSLEDVCRFFEEEGMDTEGMSPEEVEEASEVFPLSDGRYLIVEG